MRDHTPVLHRVARALPAVLLLVAACSSSSTPLPPGFDGPVPDILRPDQGAPDATLDADHGAGCTTGTAAKTITLGFDCAHLDLDTETTTLACPPLSPSSQYWDLRFTYNAAATPHAVVSHNEQLAKIAHLAGVPFASVTSCDAHQATFDTEPVYLPFDTSRVVLIQTDLGAVFKLGAQSETTTAVTFSYARLVP